MHSIIKRVALALMAVVLVAVALFFVGCSSEETEEETEEEEKQYTLLLRDSEEGTHYRFVVTESECTARQLAAVKSMHRSEMRVDVSVSQNPETMTISERKALLAAVVEAYLALDNGDAEADGSQPQGDKPADSEKPTQELLTVILQDQTTLQKYSFTFDAANLDAASKKLITDQIAKGSLMLELDRDPATMSDSEKQTLLAKVIAALTYVPPAEPKGTVFVDAGHGFTNSVGVMDKGAGEGSPYHTLTGLYESDVNLAIALILRDKLVKAGYEVIMSRESEVKEHLTVNDRARMIKYSSADFCISIHCNSAGASAMGARVYWHENNDNAEKSEEFAQSVADAINVAERVTNKEAYAAQGDYAVVRDVYIPSVLVETCFLTNQKDALMVSDPAWAERMAQALLNGIEACFGTEE